MAREYIAFISYRHKPLDMAVAKKLHRMIEHYRVPGEYRESRGKRLGLVFRDQDELPLSSDLNSSIHEALVHSQYLIVICTPDLPKSKWCMQEIDTFIALHGRDRVLTVLADGTPEESFPQQLLHETDDSGNILRDVEPLAANIAADTQAKSLRKLKGEYLRLIAAMMDCPYDALRQREKRYRQRRLVAVMSVFLAVAVVFVGMLMRKNAEVQAQYEQAQANLRQSQLNESRALTEGGWQQLNAGLRLSAIQSALAALPESEDDARPYDKGAENLLASALGVYQNFELSVQANFSQPTTINQMCVDDDVTLLITLDDSNCVRAFNAINGKELWLFAAPRNDAQEKILWVDHLRGVLYASGKTLYMLSAEDGSVLWRYDGAGTVTPDYRPGLAEAAMIENGIDGRPVVSFIRLEDGAVQKVISVGDLVTTYPKVVSSAISPDGRYAVYGVEMLDNNITYEMLIADAVEGACRVISLDTLDSMWAALRLDFAEDGTLYAICNSVDVASNTFSPHVYHFNPGTWDPVFHTQHSLWKTNMLAPDSQPNLLLSKPFLVYCSSRDIFVFSAETGAFLHQATLPGELMDACSLSDYDTDMMILDCVLDNGIVAMCIVSSDTIKIMSDYGDIDYADFRISVAKCGHNKVFNLALIPFNKRKEAVIMRYRAGSPLHSLDTHGSYVVFSPSGDEKLFLNNSKYSVLSTLPKLDKDKLSENMQNSSQYSVQSPEDGSMVTGGSLPYINNSYDESLLPVITSDGESLIVGNKVISLKDGQEASMLEPGLFALEAASSAYSSISGRVISAVASLPYSETGNASDAFSIFRDGILDETIALPEGTVLRKNYGGGIYEGFLRAGGCELVALTDVAGKDDAAIRGIAIYDVASGSWHSIKNDRELAGTFHIALGSTHKYAAIAAPDSRLSLWDVASDTVLWETVFQEGRAEVNGLYFSPGDEVIAVLSDKHNVTLLRSGSGERIAEWDMNTDLIMPIGLSVDEAEKRLYVFPILSVSPFRRGYCIDLETGATLQEIKALIGVDTTNRLLYRVGSNDQIYESETEVYPFHSLFDLIQMGRKLLE